MRTPLSALALLVALTACDTSTEPSSRTPLLSESQLREDAAILALRELARTDSLELLPVTIDRDLITSFHDALLAVRGAVHPAADSVTTLYAIRPWGQARQFFVIADMAADEFAPWRKGDRLTGVVGLDSLTLRYDIRLERYSPLHGLGWDMFILTAPVPLNLAALARDYASAPGVLDAAPDGLAGDGNDIQAERDGDAWVLDYWLAWGDCPAGCIEGHYWRFRVEDAGGVAYLGSGGDPVPSSEE